MASIPAVPAVALAAVPAAFPLGVGFAPSLPKLEIEDAGAAKERRAQDRQESAPAGAPGGDQTGQCGELLVIHASDPFRALSLGASAHDPDMMNVSGASSYDTVMLM
jgi:hypothetical protein